ncbi:hypothetical protein A3Q37_06775 [Streptomyces sp. PTY087I2]|nr:hypothetical protein A3Q37_06775 [Streptomyces sp. PTY087I2]
MGDDPARGRLRAARVPTYAKAVGIQPRTLELFERMGLVREVLDAAVPMRGQLTYVNGAEQGRGRGHVLLVYGDHPAGDATVDLASAARELTDGRMETHKILPADAPVRRTGTPHHHDSRGEFARRYGAGEGAAFVVRPDGYLTACLQPPRVGALKEALQRVFAP